MLEMQPLVSIIMNCYNSDKYLEQAINSVLNQTYSNWEIIFWDNQSIDKSALIFNSYKDKRLKYFYAPHHTSLGIARNNALIHAKGEWCAILDCDDTWTNEKLEKQIQVINRNSNFDVIYSNYYKLYDDGKCLKSNINKKVSRKKNIFNEIFTHKVTIPWPTVLIRKKLLNDVGCFYDYKSVEDFDILLKLANICNFYCIEDNLAFYRIHQNQLSINYEILRKEIFDVYDYWVEIWDFKKNYSTKNKKLVKFGKSRILFITGIRALLQNDPNTYLYFKESFLINLKLKTFCFMLITKNKKLSNIFKYIYFAYK